MSLSENIKNLRKEKGLSQQALADAIYVSRSTVAKWENGLGIPSDANLAEMAAYFKVMENEITGEPSEWALEVERIKEGYKKAFWMNIIKGLIAVVVAAALITAIVLAVPKYGKKKTVFATTKTGNEVKLLITKQYGLFTEGEAFVYSYSKDTLEDVIEIKNGTLYRKYKVTSMAYASSVNLYVPKYVKSFGELNFESSYQSDGRAYATVKYGWKNNWGYPSKSIQVSPENTVYDSREDCNCLIETETGKLLLGCENSVIPSGVTEIATGAFYGDLTKKVIHIPSTVKKIDSMAFTDLSDDGIVKITMDEGVEEIDVHAFDMCDIEMVLPISIKKLSPHFISGTSINLVYYKGGLDDLKTAVTGNWEPCYNDIPGYEGTVGLDSYLIIVYFYCEYEPVDKTNLWHYDANGNPVLWSEEN